MKQKTTNETSESLQFSQTLRWRLTLFVFAVIMSAGMMTAAVCILALTLFRRTPLVVAIMVNPFFLVFTLLGICSLFGAILAGFLGKYYLRPLKQVIRATKEVKRGNFKVQVDYSKDNSLSEMGQLIESFNDMVRDLDGIEMFRNDFINNFSHEFKTPIVSIRGFAKELQHADLNEETRMEYAKIIAEEADRLARLSINVLELSKLENQQIVTDRRDFYLDEQLRQSILLLEGEWMRKNIEIIPELREVRYHSSEAILAHVWNNLLSNAIKYTSDGGTVFVNLSCNDAAITVTVRDTGIGMTEEVQAHIFEKFYQGDPSHHRRGYGIGLTMAKRAASMLGGTISVESTLGKGSTFTVTLPWE